MPLLRSALYHWEVWLCFLLCVSEFTSLGVQWASCLFMFTASIKLRKFSTSISSNTLCLFLFGPSQTPRMRMLVCWMVSQRSLRVSSLSFKVFLSFTQTWGFPLSYLEVHGFFLQSAQICLWLPLVNFSFQLWYFSDYQCLLLSISLLIFPFCSHIIVMNFSILSLSSLSTFGDLCFKKSLSNVFATQSFFRDRLFWIVFFWMGHSFPFLCIPCDFFLNTANLDLIMWYV